jgi:methionyl-tRNA formyltransferase
MATIVQKDDPVLREVSKPVPEELFGSAELARIIADMEEALDREPDGVAIAAPQIGIGLRIFIVRYDRTLPPPVAGGEVTQTAERPADVGVYINPEFVKTSRRMQTVDEGCLSVRGIYGHTRRHERATVRARSADGKKFERGGGGILAQIFEHEIDHLNGTLFIDHAEDLTTSHHPGTQVPFAFFGTPYVAADTLEILAGRGLFPAVVVTSPDAPKGRGLALTPSEAKAWALAHDIPVLTPEKLDAKTVAEIQSYGCEYGIVVAYGKILPDALIEAFPKGLLNVHYSLLPKYRGASPVESALLAGDSVTGVTVQKLVRELDAGDVIAMEEVAIGPDDTTKTLRPRLIEVGAELLADVLPAYLAGEIEGAAQDRARATRARKITKAEGELDLSAPTEENWRKYRAYAESPGTYFFEEIKGKKTRMKITKASYTGGKFVVERVVPEGKRETEYRGTIAS